MGKYVLGGQSHLPGKTDCFETGEAEAFSLELPAYVSDDRKAVEVAEEYLSRYRKKAKSGCVIGATLWQGKRMVTNFDDLL